MNKPVMYIDKDSNITMIGGIYPKKLEEYLNGLEVRISALESHPVKELTDEEIYEIWRTCDCSQDDPVCFAKAILRKAQEK